MVMVPLPYYIRVLVFYLYEEAEIDERRSTIERLHMKVWFLPLISPSPFISTPSIICMHQYILFFNRQRLSEFIHCHISRLAYILN